MRPEAVPIFNIPPVWFNPILISFPGADESNDCPVIPPVPPVPTVIPPLKVARPLHVNTPLVIELFCVLIVPLVIFPQLSVLPLFWKAVQDNPPYSLNAPTVWLDVFFIINPLDCKFPVVSIKLALAFIAPELILPVVNNPDIDIDVIVVGVPFTFDIKLELALL